MRAFGDKISSTNTGEPGQTAARPRFQMPVTITQSLTTRCAGEPPRAGTRTPPAPLPQSSRNPPAPEPRPRPHPPPSLRSGQDFPERPEKSVKKRAKRAGGAAFPSPFTFIPFSSRQPAHASPSPLHACVQAALFILSQPARRNAPAPLHLSHRRCSSSPLASPAGRRWEEQMEEGREKKKAEPVSIFIK